MDNTVEYIRSLYRLSTRIHCLRCKNIQNKTEASVNACSLSMLEIINNNQGKNSICFCRLLGLTRSAVSQMLAKLEQQELIEKKYKDGNRKEFYLYLTDKGRQCLAEYEEIHSLFYEAFGKVLDDLNESETHTVMTFLTRSGEVLEDFSKRYLTESCAEAVLADLPVNPEEGEP